MNFKSILIVLLFLTGFHISEAQQHADSSRWYVPDFTKIQFAGSVGMLSVTLGYELGQKRFQLGPFYGYVPPLGDDREIHHTGIRFFYLPFGWHLGKDMIIHPHTALGVSYKFADGEDTFVTLPDQYPEDYYKPNAFRLLLTFGGSLKKNFGDGSFFEAVDFYAGFTTVEIYAVYFFKSKHVRLGDIFSLELGTTLYF